MRQALLTISGRSGLDRAMQRTNTGCKADCGERCCLTQHKPGKSWHRQTWQKLREMMRDHRPTVAHIIIMRACAGTKTNEAEPSFARVLDSTHGGSYVGPVGARCPIPPEASSCCSLCHITQAVRTFYVDQILVLEICRVGARGHAKHREAVGVFLILPCSGFRSTGAGLLLRSV